MRGLLLTTALCSMAFIGSASADWAPTMIYNLGDASVGQIGDEIGTPFDILSLSGTVGTTAPDFQQVGTFSLNGGTGNCVSCTLTPSGVLATTFSIGGMTQTLDVNHSWSSNTVTDTLVLNIDPITFVNLPGSGGENIEAFFGSLTTLVVSASSPLASEALSARFEVPEPATLAILGLGMTGLGFVRRRKARIV